MSEQIGMSDQPEFSVALPTDGELSILPRVVGIGFGRRAVAYIIDWLLLSVANALALIAAFIFLSAGMLTMINLNGDVSRFQNQVSMPGRASLTGVGMLVNLLYFASFEGVYGATPGKLIVGIRVIKEKNGRLCDLKTAFIRGLWRFVDGFFFGVLALNSMKPPRQQRLGDKKAGTLVVGKDEALIQERREWPRFLVGLGLFLVILMVVSLIQLGVTLF